MAKVIAVLVFVSSYYPGWGGTNCSNFVNGKCIARTASGERWEDWVDRGAACPRMYMGQTFVIDGKGWVCVDTGGSIYVQRDGVIRVDLMTKNPPYDYGTIVEAELIQGGNDVAEKLSGVRELRDRNEGDTGRDMGGGDVFQSAEALQALLRGFERVPCLRDAGCQRIR